MWVLGGHPKPASEAAGAQTRAQGLAAWDEPSLIRSLGFLPPCQQWWVPSGLPVRKCLAVAVRAFWPHQVKGQLFHFFFKGSAEALGCAAQLTGMSSREPKGCGFTPRSGRVWEATGRCFPLTSMFLSFSVSLLLSVKPMNIF